PMLNDTWYFSLTCKGLNTKAANAMSTYCTGLVKDATTIRDDPGSCLSATINGSIGWVNVMSRELLKAGKQIKAHKPADRSSTWALTQSLPLVMKKIEEASMRMPGGLKLGSYALPDFYSWAKDRDKLISQVHDVPWWVWIPLVGIVPYKPFQRGLYNAAEGVADFATKNTAVLLGPIIIPILSAWHISIEPHKFIDITKAKIEVIQKLADPTLSDGEKWKHILNLSGDRLLDIAFSKVVKVGYEGSPLELGQTSGSNLTGMQQWLQNNRRALTSNMIAALIKGAAKDTKKEILGLSKPSDIWSKMPDRVIKETFKQLLGAQLKSLNLDDKTLEWAYKLMIQDSSKEL
ncbi:MAG: hypothetical protein HN348_32195, partial [Proteobacteria bacterium]|nr:hypothetical protein [Pseudomonadota bacterium]